VTPGRGDSGILLQSADATTLFSGTWYTLSSLPTPVTAPQEIEGGQ
jgi:hypothetical protein